MMEPLLYFKGFQALQAYRLSHWLLKAGRRDFALSLQSLVSAAFGVDINPAARIGKGVFLDHATGLVVGETTVIEDNVSILQGVTLGRHRQGDRRPPSQDPAWRPDRRRRQDPRQYRNRLLRARRRRLGRPCAGAAQQDGGRRPGAHCRRGRLRGARARHEPDPGRKSVRSPRARRGRSVRAPCRTRALRAKACLSWDNRARTKAPWTKPRSSSCANFCVDPSARRRFRSRPNSKSAEAADVSLGERKIGAITVDDEDGDRSFSFAMSVPVGRPVLQDYFRRLFENDKLTDHRAPQENGLGRTQQRPRLPGRRFRR